MQFHPYAELFPLLEGPAFQELVDDIREFGLREPIWMYEGQILDGRNRYRACLEAGVEPEFRAFKGTEQGALAFVVSVNLRRRHLTESQRAMVAARIATLRTGQRPEDGNAQICAFTQEQAAEKLGVSRRSVQHARRVIEQGSDELRRAVETGEVSVSRAAAVVDRPKEEQLEAARQKPSQAEKPEPLEPEEPEAQFDEAEEDAALEAAESEYRERIEKIISADDRLSAAAEEIKRLSGLYAAVAKERDRLLNEQGRLTRMLKAAERKVARLEKENADLRRQLGLAA